MASFDYIQTFYVNPDTVANAAEIMLTSVDLFFKSKPLENANVSGGSKPGIVVWICQVENGSPIPSSTINNSVLSVDYDLVNISNDAQTATTIGFKNPVVLKSGRYYGITVKFLDPAYDIWTNVQGDRLISAGSTTNNPSPGSQSRFDGFLYKSTNTNTYDRFTNKDLKFSVKVAQFTSDTATISLVNKDYEFLTIDASIFGALIGGEQVYQNIANAAGTVTFTSSSNTITGVGTSFDNYSIDNYIVLANNTSRDMVKITNIINSTTMTVDRFPNFSATSFGYKVPPVGIVYYTDYTKNKVYLVDSSANTTVKFQPAERIIGIRTGASANVVSVDKFRVDNFKPSFLIGNPSTSDYSISYNIANSSDEMPASPTNLELLKFNNAPGESYFLSRSHEVESINLYGTSRKSAIANIQFNTAVSDTNRFSVPYLNTAELDFFFYQNEINNTYTETRGSIVNYDTEVDHNGFATSKYISKKISFGEGKYAQDLIVYLAGYRPSGTEIKVYVKIHNAADKESFDDKSWTPLVLNNNIDRYSTENPKDIWEYTYGLPQYPEVDVPLLGSFLTASSCTSISTTVDQSTALSTGDLVKIYSVLTPENHEVFPVSSANSTAITVFRPVTNINIVGDVGIEKLKYKNIAWNNIANDNVARYVTSSYTEFDTYNTMQIKVVMLSDTTHIVPKVEQIQVIGVSS
jgi:hypothetical protein